MSIKCELIYASKNPNMIEYAELVQIVRKNKERNEARGIKSLLLFDQDYFCQILQGEVDTVLETYARIKKDSRHENVEIKLIRTGQYLELEKDFGVHLVWFKASLRPVFLKYCGVEYFNPLNVEPHQLEKFLLEISRLRSNVFDF